MTNTPRLGRVERVDVRSIWQHEAHAFTPWLADSLHILGEALGMDLEVLQQEASVGRFSLDILAREVCRDIKVAIENQLEETDHGHLGQLLTYAAGYDARVVIWVTPTFHDEHRAAIDWLNRWTPEEIEFYAVELRAIRIADSLPAPEFRPVAFPNGWSKQRQLPSRGLSSRGRQFREFFQPLVDELRRRGLTNQARAYARNYQGAPSPVNGVEYGVGLFTPNDALAYVLISTGDRELDGRVLDALKANSDDFEAGIDADWQWNRLAGLSTIAVRSEGSIDDPLDRQQETREWMLSHLLKLRDVLDQRLESVLSELRHEIPSTQDD